MPHLTQQCTNNRIKNSHQPTKLREKKMRKFKSLKQAQLFLSCFGNIYDHLIVQGNYVQLKPLVF